MREYKPLSEAAIKARLRNHRVRQLRCIFSMTHSNIDPDLGNTVRDIIDAQLARLDAQPEGERQAQDRAAWEEGKGLWEGYGKRRKFVPYNLVNPDH